MSEQRREAWRLPHSGAGWLAARDYRAMCVVEDISVTGARVRLVRVRMTRARALPEQLTLTTTIAGEQVSVDGEVTRIERGDDGVRLALRFDNGEEAWLGWWINQAQREAIRAEREAPVA